MSCSLPSSLDFPKAHLGRPSSYPLAFTAASTSLLPSEIKSRSTSANNSNRAIITLVHRSCLPSSSIPSLMAMNAKHARYYWMWLAEGHLNRRLFGEMLHRIAALPAPGG